MLILTVISITAYAGTPRDLPTPETWQPDLDEKLPSYRPCKTTWQRELSGSVPPIMPDLVHSWITEFTKWQPNVSFQLGTGFRPPQGRLNPYLQEFLTGQRDFAFLSRELASADLETFIQHLGYPPLAIPVAMGGSGAGYWVSGLKNKACRVICLIGSYPVFQLQTAGFIKREIREIVADQRDIKGDGMGRDQAVKVGLAVWMLSGQHGVGICGMPAKRDDLQKLQQRVKRHLACLGGSAAKLAPGNGTDGDFSTPVFGKPVNDFWRLALGNINANIGVQHPFNHDKSLVSASNSGRTPE